MALLKPRAILLRSTRALQPAATAVAEGGLSRVTDEDIVERTNGSAWQFFANGSTNAAILALALAQQEAIDDAAWTSVAHGSLTFTAQSGTWTVDSGDLAYFKFVKVGTRVFLKGAITGSSTSATPTELRVTVPGVTFAGNDSFGFTVYTQDGFGTQDCGQSICRVSSGLLVFKPRVGGTWNTVTNQTGVIWNLVGECAA